VPCPRRTGYFICCRCSHAWFADARHLWPEMWRLVSRGRPVCVFGEQVAGSDGEVWLAAVRASLEILGYRFWPAGLNAAGFGAPHIRQRLYFVAESQYSERRTVKQSREDGRDGADPGRKEAHSIVGTCREVCPMADAAGERTRWAATPELGDAGGPGLSQRERDGRIQREALESFKGQTPECRGDPDESRVPSPEPRSTNGFWRDAEWLWCRDGKYRAVEPGTFPLAHGVAARVGRLRGYGNALCAPVAESFIRAYLEVQARGREK
jgi:DNA (cytosine-5)-methyltransferase 1